MTCEVNAGIIEAGIFGYVVTGLVEGGIASGVNFPVTAQIGDPIAALPILPLAAHVGNGSVFFTWIQPSGNPFSYEIQAAEQEAGPYFAYGQSVFYHTCGVIKNFPMYPPGRSLCFRIRTLTQDPDIFSEWEQVRLGILQKQQTTMLIRAPYKSIIGEGARVAIVDEAARLAGFSCDEEVTVE